MRARWLLSAPLALPALLPRANAQAGAVPGAGGTLAWSAVAALALLTLLAGAAWSRHRLKGATEPTTFLGHLAELQSRLRVTLLFFALYNFVFFLVGFTLRSVGGFPVPWPVLSTDASVSAVVFHRLSEKLVPEGVTLVTTRPVDAILAQVQVGLLLAFVVTLPLLAYEIAAFLAPALDSRERRAAMRAVPAVVALFAAGLLFGYHFMVPLILRTLYAFAGGLDVTPLLVVSEFMGFTTVMLLLFGLAFEMPVVMGVLSRLGIVHPRTWRRKWRYAVIGIFVLAAIITPDPSVVNQVLVAIPLLALYLLGLLAARWTTPLSRGV